MVLFRVSSCLEVTHHERHQMGRNNTGQNRNREGYAVHRTTVGNSKWTCCVFHNKVSGSWKLTEAKMASLDKPRTRFETIFPIFIGLLIGAFSLGRWTTNKLM